MTFWDTIVDTKASRNDFMSHGAYVTLIVLATMTVAKFGADNTWVLIIVGVIAGTVASIAREVYDEIDSGSWSWYDILAGVCGTGFAVLCMIILRGG